MTITRTIQSARRQTATLANRLRQRKAEQRLEELVKIAGIPDEYERRGRSSDLAVETAFATCYQLVNTEDERAAVVRAFQLWQRDEKHEKGIVRDLTDESVQFLKDGNDLFLNDGCGPTGRAA